MERECVGPAAKRDPRDPLRHRVVHASATLKPPLWPLHWTRRSCSAKAPGRMGSRWLIASNFHLNPCARTLKDLSPHGKLKFPVCT